MKYVKQHICLNFVILFVAIIIVSCSKDDTDDGWSYCPDCDTESWVGTYTGGCSVYDGLNNLTFEEQIATIVISSNGNDVLSMQISVPVHFSMYATGSLQNSYSISLSGTEKSFLATMYKKENQLRLTGSAKTYHYKGGELELIKSVNFETLKQQKFT